MQPCRRGSGGGQLGAAPGPGATPSTLQEVGVTQTLDATDTPTAYVAALALLLVRPAGLFGRRSVERA